MGLLLGAAAGCSPSGPGLKKVEKATLTVVVDGAGEFTPSRQVDLKHRWDSEFGGRSGKAIYDIDLSKRLDGAGAAMILRSGSQLDVVVDNGKVRTIGRSPFADAAKSSYLIELPSGAKRLRVIATIQGLRGGGLAPVFVGRIEDVEANAPELPAVESFTQHVETFDEAAACEVDQDRAWL